MRDFFRKLDETSQAGAFEPHEFYVASRARARDVLTRPSGSACDQSEPVDHSRR